MSNHADIVKFAVASAIKQNLSFDGFLDFINTELEAADFGDDLLYSTDEVHDLVRYNIIGQRDGLYGVSHQEAREWIIAHPNLHIDI